MKQIVFKTLNLTPFMTVQQKHKMGLYLNLDAHKKNKAFCLKCCGRADFVNQCKGCLMSTNYIMILIDVSVKAEH